MGRAVFCTIGGFAAVSPFREGEEHGMDMFSRHAGKKVKSFFADEIVYLVFLCYNISHKAFFFWVVVNGW